MAPENPERQYTSPGARSGSEASGEASTSFRADLDTIRTDLNKLRSDVGELVQTLIDVGKDQAQVTGSKLSEATSQQMENLGRVKENVKEKASAMVQDLQGRVEERPLMALAIAFGVGMLLGKMMDRS